VTGTLHGGERQAEVQASCTLSAPAETVWALIGDFTAPHCWIPGIRGVEMQDDGVGSVRACQTVLGSFREQLIAAGPMWCAYVILDGPLPVLNYESMLMVQPASDFDSCRVTWESAFDPAPGAEMGAVRRHVARLYDAGLGALQKQFGSQDTGPLFRLHDLGDVSISAFLDKLNQTTDGC
jgi:hypothetical protein